MVKIKKTTLVGVLITVLAASIVVVLTPAPPLRAATPAPPLTAGSYGSPLTATTPNPAHNTSAYWLSLWYSSHPQYHPTASDIKAMRANPQDVVPGYKIPLTAPGVLNSTTTNTTSTQAPVNK